MAVLTTPPQRPDRPQPGRSATPPRRRLIERIQAENYGVYGTVARLMRAAGLRGTSQAKGPRTTIPGSGPDTRPDLLDRHFVAPAPNRV